MKQGAAPIFVRALALGLAWYAVELMLALTTGAGTDARLVAQAWLGLLPWQLLLFAGIGVGSAALAVVLPRGAVSWWILGAATLALLGVRMLEGALRTSSIGSAVATLAACALVIALVLGAVAAIGRWLPPRSRRAWPLAATIAWTALLIPFARAAGTSIALGELPLRRWPEFLAPASVAAALLAGGLALWVGSRRRGAKAVLLLVAAVPLDARAATPDVVFVLLDTLRADHVGAREGRASLTPNLDTIAAEALLFRRAYSPANVTRRAMPALLACSTERVVGAPLAAEIRTLATELSAAGLTSIGLSANPFVSRLYGYDRGFERFSDPSDVPTFLVAPLVQLLLNVDGGLGYRLGLADGSLYYEPAGRLFARGQRLLRPARPPVFLYLHVMDVHGPYLPPRRFLPPGYDPDDYVAYSPFLRLPRETLLDPRHAPLLDNVRQRYAAGVRSMDEQLGALREALVRDGRWDEALVWIVSDHGEALGEQGFAGHGVASLMPALIHVPLIVKLPRSWGVAPREIAEPVSTADGMPTLLELLGRPRLEQCFGESFAETLRGAPLGERDVLSWTTNGGVDLHSAIRNEWQLTVGIGPGGERERRLFDLARDPGALTDVAVQQPGLVAALEQQIDAHRAREARLARGASGQDVDAETRARLEALGYVGDEAPPGTTP